jgi:hypothetical protein
MAPTAAPDADLMPHQTRVRVTMFTDPIVVDRDEIENLRTQGILVDDEPEVSAAGGGAGAAKPPQTGTAAS